MTSGNLTHSSGHASDLRDWGILATRSFNHFVWRLETFAGISSFTNDQLICGKILSHENRIESIIIIVYEYILVNHFGRFVLIVQRKKRVSCVQTNISFHCLSPCYNKPSDNNSQFPMFVSFKNYKSIEPINETDDQTEFYLKYWKREIIIQKMNRHRRIPRQTQVLYTERYFTLCLLL